MTVEIGSFEFDKLFLNCPVDLKAIYANFFFLQEFTGLICHCQAQIFG